MYERAIPGQRLRIPAADWNAAMAAAEAHAASGKSGAGGSHGRDRWEFGKLDSAVVAGVNTGKTMSVWHGPAWDTDDAATGDKLPVDYATEALDSGVYVVATLKRGKWYVQPFACGGEAPA